jgi:DNA-binding LytR/AlgR family response regulator
MKTTNKIKVLIIEDELLIAEDMRINLEKLGYYITGIGTSYNEALQLVEKDLPDIALIDIVIDGDKDGIEVAKTVKSKYKVPIIFLTSHSDKDTVEKAKTAHPNGYLVKPFNSQDLFTSIEIAFHNHSNNLGNKNIEENESSFVIKDFIFIKKDYLLVKIKFNELRWIKAEGNYIEIYCENKKFLTRSTLKDFLHKLPEEMFVQVHKSYAVNIEFIEAIEFNKIIIGKDKIPVSRSLIPEIKRKLQIDL